MKKTVYLISVFLMLALATAVHAQQLPATDTINDTATGESLIGFSIRIKCIYKMESHCEKWVGLGNCLCLVPSGIDIE
jgi:hypothetical protein